MPARDYDIIIPNELVMYPYADTDHYTFGKSHLRVNRRTFSLEEFRNFHSMVGDPVFDLVHKRRSYEVSAKHLAKRNRTKIRNGLKFTC